MKYLAWFTGILITLVVLVYVVAFTPFGNSLVQPIVEKKIQDQTGLDSKLDTFVVTMSQIDVVLKLDKSNSIMIKGNYSLLSKDIDIAYGVNFENLKTLELLIGTALNGVLHVDGDIKGSLSNLVVNGKSDLALSDTEFEAVIQEFAPKSVKAQVDNLKLDNLFHMLGQPHYSDGVLSLYADISDASVGSLKGEVITNLKNGLLDSAYLTKAYDFNSTVPRITFNSKTTTLLNGDTLDTKVDFNSNIVNLDIEKASLNIKDNSLKSDYITSIANLDKLFFITGQHLKGGITANGNISKAKDLDLTMHTKVAGGNIDAKLHNSDLHADIKSVQTTGLLHMLIYPEIFSSSLNAKLDYNLEGAKGKFEGHVTDGHFVKNQTFDLVKKYTKIDMYRESFNGDVVAKINKENILASLDLRSKQASIKTVDAKLNTKNKTVDSDVTLQAKKNVIPVNLKGDVNSPKVTIDMEKLMKSKAGEEIQKGINKLFKKLF